MHWGVREMAKRIRLTNGQDTLVDDVDYEHLAKYQWRVSMQGYVTRQQGSARRKTRQTIVMHREITDPLPWLHVDHVNGDRLDNRRCNLRVCEPRQNNYNKKAQYNNRSGYKGVRYCRRTGRYAVSITYGRRDIWLGRHDTPEDAARAYNRAAREYFGEYACLNDVPEPEEV